MNPRTRSRITASIGSNQAAPRNSGDVLRQVSAILLHGVISIGVSPPSLARCTSRRLHHSEFPPLPRRDPTTTKLAPLLQHAGQPLRGGAGLVESAATRARRTFSASWTPAAATCLIELRWRCVNCQSRLTDFVCTGRFSHRCHSQLPLAKHCTLGRAQNGFVAERLLANSQGADRGEAEGQDPLVTARAPP